MKVDIPEDHKKAIIQKIKVMSNEELHIALDKDSRKYESDFFIEEVRKELKRRK